MWVLSSLFIYILGFRSQVDDHESKQSWPFALREFSHYFLAIANCPVIPITAKSVGNDRRAFVGRACSPSAQLGAASSTPHLLPLSPRNYRSKTSNVSADSSAPRVHCT